MFYRLSLPCYPTHVITARYHLISLITCFGIYNSSTVTPQPLHGAAATAFVSVLRLGIFPSSLLAGRA